MFARPPSVRILRLDLSVTPVDLPMFLDTLSRSLHTLPSDELLLSQIFHTESARSAAMVYLHPWEVIPSALRCSGLVRLEIKVASTLYPLLEHAMARVSNTLTDLVLHLRECQYPFNYVGN